MTYYEPGFDPATEDIVILDLRFMHSLIEHRMIKNLRWALGWYPFLLATKNLAIQGRIEGK